LTLSAASRGEWLAGVFNIAPQCLLNSQGRRFFENLALPMQAELMIGGEKISASKELFLRHETEWG